MRLFPLIALGGGAALLMASRGKKKKTPDEELGEMDDADVAAGDKPARTSVSPKPKTREQQTVLHELGYGSIVGAIDGKMGKNTRNGIKSFQREYNQWDERRKPLEVDGKWGPNTSDAADHALRAMAERGASSFGEVVSGAATGGGAAPSASRSLPAPTMSRQITFSEAGDKYAIHAQFRYTTLQDYLVKAKNKHMLLTKSDKQTWGKFFYDTFVKDPSTFLGEVTGGGDNVGAAVYAGLWIIATMGAAAAVGSAAAGGAAASGAATSTALAIPASSTTAVAATSPAIATVVIPAGGTATAGLAASSWGAWAVAGTYAAATGGALYLLASGIKDMAQGPKISKSAYDALIKDLGKKYPLWAQHPDMASSALETFFSFLDSHYAYVGERGIKVRLADLPPSQTAIAVYNIILGNIYRFQASN